MLHRLLDTHHTAIPKQANTCWKKVHSSELYHFTQGWWRWINNTRISIAQRSVYESVNEFSMRFYTFHGLVSTLMTVIIIINFNSYEMSTLSMLSTGTEHTSISTAYLQTTVYFIICVWQKNVYQDCNTERREMEVVRTCINSM